jgi:hypothetical protein
MKGTRQRLFVGQPATYRIEVQGWLNDSWSSWLNDMTLAVQTGDDGLAITVLTGTVADQSALHGLLARIRDLNLALLLVKRVRNKEPACTETPDRPAEERKKR